MVCRRVRRVCCSEDEEEVEVGVEKYEGETEGRKGVIKEDRKEGRVCVAPRIRMEESRKGVLRLSVTCV